MMLYSVNIFLKYYIQQLYYGDIHYVWCSENFDSRLIAPHLPGYQVPPTSNPAEIYEDLKKAIQRGDKHNYKILEQRNTIKKYAISSCSSGRITDMQRDEIIYLADSPLSNMWRPILYNIPRPPVEARLNIVPMDLRAGFGVEYTISDLKRTEFDITEP